MAEAAEVVVEWAAVALAGVALVVASVAAAPMVARVAAAVAKAAHRQALRAAWPAGGQMAAEQAALASREGAWRVAAEEGAAVRVVVGVASAAKEVTWAGGVASRVYQPAPGVAMRVAEAKEEVVMAGVAEGAETLVAVVEAAESVEEA